MKWPERTGETFAFAITICIVLLIGSLFIMAFTARWG